MLDKKPGHFHQTEGIAKALERVTPIAAERLKIRQRPFILVGMLRLLMKFRLAPRFWLWALYGIRLSKIARPDGIIASGRPTIAAAILLARHFQVPLVHSGRIVGYDTRDVTLQLVGKSRYAGRPGYAHVPKPTLVDPSLFTPAKSILAPTDLIGANVALLLGGDSNDHHYTNGEWGKLADFLKGSSAALALRWHVTTSRRSPPYLSDILADIARTGLINFIDYRQAGPGSAAYLFGLDAIVVTADSRSMIAESIAAHRPVIILRPEKVDGSTIGEFLSSQAQNGPLKILPIAQLDATTFAAALVGLTVKPLAAPQDLILAAVAPIFGLSLPEGPAT